MPVFVNQVEITDEQVFQEMQYHPAPTPEEAMQEAAKALTIRELLLQEARIMGIDDKGGSAGSELKADDERIQKLLMEVIKVPELDDVSCRRFYDNNRSQFTRSGQLSAFEDVKAAIAEYLRDTSWHTAVRQYIMILVGRAKIAGIDLKAADSPLVQ